MSLSKAEIDWTGGEPDSDFRAGYRAAIQEAHKLVTDARVNPIDLRTLSHHIARLDDIDEPYGN